MYITLYVILRAFVHNLRKIFLLSKFEIGKEERSELFYKCRIVLDLFAANPIYHTQKIFFSTSFIIQNWCCQVAQQFLYYSAPWIFVTYVLSFLIPNRPKKRNDLFPTTTLVVSNPQWSRIYWFLSNKFIFSTLCNPLSRNSVEFVLGI